MDQPQLQPQPGQKLLVLKHDDGRWEATIVEVEYQAGTLYLWRVVAEAKGGGRWRPVVGLVDGELVTYETAEAREALEFTAGS